MAGLALDGGQGFLIAFSQDSGVSHAKLSSWVLKEPSTLEYSTIIQFHRSVRASTALSDEIER
jgi:hypothetical protein